MLTHREIERLIHATNSTWPYRRYGRRRVRNLLESHLIRLIKKSSGNLHPIFALNSLSKNTIFSRKILSMSHVHSHGLQKVGRLLVDQDY